MSKNRIEWIDFVRAIAILTVLYVHATDGIYIISSNTILNYTIYSRIFNFASLYIGRIGVPFFLMITGYLLLDRTYKDKDVRNFWRKNCKEIIIVTIIWTIIYALCLQFITVNSHQISLNESGTLFFSHMWYMPMIIGMYLSIPFVSTAIKQFDTDTIWNATIVFTLIAFLLPFLTTLLSMNGIKSVNIQYCLGFSGGVYGIYIILGYLIKKGKFKNIPSYQLGIVALLSFMITLFFQYYTFIKGYDFYLWYEFPFILTGSFALFELCSRIDKIRAFPFVSFLSKYSFAVFLVHNIYRIPLLPLIVDLPFSEPIKAIILWILLIFLSYLTTIIIYRIPRFGKYVLYME